MEILCCQKRRGTHSQISEQELKLKWTVRGSNKDVGLNFSQQKFKFQGEGVHAIITDLSFECTKPGVKKGCLAYLKRT